MTGNDIRLSISGDVRPLVRDVQKGVNMAQMKIKPIKLDFDEKSLSMPLGRIRSDLGQFSKSMDAAFARVVTFGAAVGIINSVKESFKALVNQTKEVEKQLTSINVIFNASSKDLSKIRSELFGIAKETATSIGAVSDAAVEFSRQGLGMAETVSRTRDSLILMRVSGFDAKSSVEALTAAVNGFSSSAITTTEVLNKLVAVESAFAVSSRDLSDAIARSASVAQDAGVSLDELLALTASVQQSTARGGKVIGNAFKTIFSRLQRGGTIEQLRELGVEINATQSGMEKLAAIASRVKQVELVDPTQAARIKELSAGVFQINILSAALRDIGKDISLVNNALGISVQATDEAIKRNMRLNETLDAMISQTGTKLSDLLSKVGGIQLLGDLKNVVGSVSSAIDTINDSLDGEGVGANLGQGIVKGLTGFLTGPALMLGVKMIFSILKETGKQVKNAFAELTGLNNQTKQREALETAVFQVISNSSRELKNQIASTSDISKRRALVKTALEQELLVMQQQKRIMAEMANLAAQSGFAVVAGKLSRTLTRAPIRTGSEGFVPSMMKESVDIGRGVGGAKPWHKPVAIKNFNYGEKRGPIVVHTGEKIVENFMGGSGSAVFNPQMIKSVGGLKNLSSFGRVKNVAEGYAPKSYAKSRFGQFRIDEHIGEGSFKDVFSLLENQQVELFGSGLNSEVEAWMKSGGMRGMESVVMSILKRSNQDFNKHSALAKLGAPVPKIFRLGGTKIGGRVKDASLIERLDTSIMDGLKSFDIKPWSAGEANVANALSQVISPYVSSVRSSGGWGGTPKMKGDLRLSNLGITMSAAEDSDAYEDIKSGLMNAAYFSGTLSEFDRDLVQDMFNKGLRVLDVGFLNPRQAARGHVPNMMMPHATKKKSKTGTRVLSLPSGSEVTYKNRTKDLHLKYIESKERGDGFSLFNKTVDLGKRIGKPLYSDMLMSQAYKKTMKLKAAGPVERLFQHYPQLRYRDQNSLQNSMTMSVYDEGADRFQRTKITSIDELKEIFSGKSIREVDKLVNSNYIEFSNLRTRRAAGGMLPQMNPILMDRAINSMMLKSGGVIDVPMDNFVGKRFFGSSKEKVLDDVWNMLNISYGKIGVPSAGKNQFLEDDFDSTFFDVLFDNEGPQAFNVAKVTPYGYKGVATGTYGTEAGKRAWRERFQFLKRPSYYSELSGAPRAIAIKNNFPRIPADNVSSIINKNITKVDEYNYRRKVGIIGEHEKSLFGVPLLIDGAAGGHLPTPLAFQRSRIYKDNIAPNIMDNFMDLTTSRGGKLQKFLGSTAHGLERMVSSGRISKHEMDVIMQLSSLPINPDSINFINFLKRGNKVVPTSFGMDFNDVPLVLTNSLPRDAQSDLLDRFGVSAGTKESSGVLLKTILTRGMAGIKSPVTDRSGKILDVMEDGTEILHKTKQLHKLMPMHGLGSASKGYVPNFNNKRPLSIGARNFVGTWENSLNTKDATQLKASNLGQYYYEAVNKELELLSSKTGYNKDTLAFSLAALSGNTNDVLARNALPAIIEGRQVVGAVLPSNVEKVNKMLRSGGSRKELEDLLGMGAKTQNFARTILLEDEFEGMGWKKRGGGYKYAPPHKSPVVVDSWGAYTQQGGGLLDKYQRGMVPEGIRKQVFQQGPKGYEVYNSIGEDLVEAARHVGVPVRHMQGRTWGYTRSQLGSASRGDYASEGYVPNFNNPAAAAILMKRRAVIQQAYFKNKTGKTVDEFFGENPAEAMRHMKVFGDSVWPNLSTTSKYPQMLELADAGDFESISKLINASKGYIPNMSTSMSVHRGVSFMNRFGLRDTKRKFTDLTTANQILRHGLIDDPADLVDYLAKSKINTAKGVIPSSRSEDIAKDFAGFGFFKKVPNSYVVEDVGDDLSEFRIMDAAHGVLMSADVPTSGVIDNYADLKRLFKSEKSLNNLLEGFHPIITNSVLDDFLNSKDVKPSVGKELELILQDYKSEDEVSFLNNFAPLQQIRAKRIRFASDGYVPNYAGKGKDKIDYGRVVPHVIGDGDDIFAFGNYGALRNVRPRVSGGPSYVIQNQDRSYASTTTQGVKRLAALKRLANERGGVAKFGGLISMELDSEFASNSFGMEAGNFYLHNERLMTELDGYADFVGSAGGLPKSMSGRAGLLGEFIRERVSGLKVIDVVNGKEVKKRFTDLKLQEKLNNIFKSEFDPSVKRAFESGLHEKIGSGAIFTHSTVTDSKGDPWGNVGGILALNRHGKPESRHDLYPLSTYGRDPIELHEPIGKDFLTSHWTNDPEELSFFKKDRPLLAHINGDAISAAAIKNEPLLSSLLDPDDPILSNNKDVRDRVKKQRHDFLRKEILSNSVLRENFAKQIIESQLRGHYSSFLPIGIRFKGGDQLDKMLRNGQSPRRATNGYIPSLFDKSALLDSISREVKALSNMGYSKKDAVKSIKVDASPMLKNRQNPMGLGVFNTLQKQHSISKAISDHSGENVKLAGMVPNLATYGKGMEFRDKKGAFTSTNYISKMLKDYDVALQSKESELSNSLAGQLEALKRRLHGESAARVSKLINEITSGATRVLSTSIDVGAAKAGVSTGKGSKTPPRGPQRPRTVGAGQMRQEAVRASEEAAKVAQREAFEIDYLKKSSKGIGDIKTSVLALTPSAMSGDSASARAIEDYKKQLKNIADGAKGMGKGIPQRLGTMVSKAEEDFIKERTKAIVKSYEEILKIPQGKPKGKIASELDRKRQEITGVAYRAKDGLGGFVQNRAMPFFRGITSSGRGLNKISSRENEIVKLFDQKVYNKDEYKALMGGVDEARAQVFQKQMVNKQKWQQRTMGVSFAASMGAPFVGTAVSTALGGGERGERGGAVASGTLQGVAMGAMFGPWGMAIGGLAGAATEVVKNFSPLNMAAKSLSKEFEKVSSAAARNAEASNQYMQTFGAYVDALSSGNVDAQNRLLPRLTEAFSSITDMKLSSDIVGAGISLEQISEAIAKGQQRSIKEQNQLAFSALVVDNSKSFGRGIKGEKSGEVVNQVFSTAGAEAGKLADSIVEIGEIDSAESINKLISALKEAGVPTKELENALRKGADGSRKFIDELLKKSKDIQTAVGGLENITHLQKLLSTSVTTFGKSMFEITRSLKSVTSGVGLLKGAFNSELDFQAARFPMTQKDSLVLEGARNFRTLDIDTIQSRASEMARVQGLMESASGVAEGVGSSELLKAAMASVEGINGPVEALSSFISRLESSNNKGDEKVVDLIRQATLIKDEIAAERSEAAAHHSELIKSIQTNATIQTRNNYASAGSNIWGMQSNVVESVRNRGWWQNDNSERGAIEKGRGIEDVVSMFGGLVDSENDPLLREIFGDDVKGQLIASREAKLTSAFRANNITVDSQEIKRMATASADNTLKGDRDIPSLLRRIEESSPVVGAVKNLETAMITSLDQILTEIATQRVKMEQDEADANLASSKNAVQQTARQVSGVVDKSLTAGLNIPDTVNPKRFMNNTEVLQSRSVSKIPKESLELYEQLQSRLKIIDDFDKAAKGLISDDQNIRSEAKAEIDRMQEAYMIPDGGEASQEKFLPSSFFVGPGGVNTRYENLERAYTGVEEAKKLKVPNSKSSQGVRAPIGVSGVKDWRTHDFDSVGNYVEMYPTLGRPEHASGWAEASFRAGHDTARADLDTSYKGANVPQTVEGASFSPLENLSASLRVLESGIDGMLRKSALNIEASENTLRMKMSERPVSQRSNINYDFVLGNIKQNDDILRGRSQQAGTMSGALNEIFSLGTLGSNFVQEKIGLPSSAVEEYLKTGNTDGFREIISELQKNNDPILADKAREQAITMEGVLSEMEDLNEQQKQANIILENTYRSQIDAAHRAAAEGFAGGNILSGAFDVNEKVANFRNYEGGTTLSKISRAEGIRDLQVLMRDLDPSFLEKAAPNARQKVFEGNMAAVQTYNSRNNIGLSREMMREIAAAQTDSAFQKAYSIQDLFRDGLANGSPVTRKLDEIKGLLQSVLTGKMPASTTATGDPLAVAAGTDGGSGLLNGASFGGPNEVPQGGLSGVSYNFGLNNYAPKSVFGSGGYSDSGSDDSPTGSMGWGLTDFSERMKSGFDNMSSYAQDIGLEISNAYASIPSRFSDGIADAMSDAVTGAESFGDGLRNMFSAVMLDLGRMFMRQGMANLFAGIGSRFNKGGEVKKFSKGGEVVPALVMGGEFIAGPDLVRQHGKELFDIINKGQDVNLVKKFNTGGFVRGGSGIRDDVPMSLPAGSFVINKRQSMANKDFLSSLSAGSKPQKRTWGGLLGQIFGGALQGAAVGALTSAITGNDVGKGALMGAAGGALAGGISYGISAANGTNTTGGFADGFKNSFGWMSGGSNGPTTDTSSAATASTTTSANANFAFDTPATQSIAPQSSVLNNPSMNFTTGPAPSSAVQPNFSFSNFTPTFSTPANSGAFNALPTPAAPTPLTPINTAAGPLTQTQNFSNALYGVHQNSMTLGGGPQGPMFGYAGPAPKPTFGDMMKDAGKQLAAGVALGMLSKYMDASKKEESDSFSEGVFDHSNNSVTAQNIFSTKSPSVYWMNKDFHDTASLNKATKKYGLDWTPDEDYGRPIFFGSAGGSPKGGPTVPSMVMGGEYIASPQQVKEHGVDFWQKLNNGNISSFATGGLVGTASSYNPIRTFADGGFVSSDSSASGSASLDFSSISSSFEILNSSILALTEVLSGGGENGEISAIGGSEGSESGTIFNISVIVNGSEATVEQGSEGGRGSEKDKEKGNGLAARIKQVIMDEKRPGGLLA